MFGDGSLTFREFLMHEPLPLATIHDAVLEFLRGRDDAVLFGAQAVNAYVDEPRMTQDVDILSWRAAELVEELQNYLHQRFQMACGFAASQREWATASINCGNRRIDIWSLFARSIRCRRINEWATCWS